MTPEDNVSRLMFEVDRIAQSVWNDHEQPDINKIVEGLMPALAEFSNRHWVFSILSREIALAQMTYVYLSAYLDSATSTRSISKAEAINFILSRIKERLCDEYNLSPDDIGPI